MVVLNEKDADRIASYLRNSLQKLEEGKNFALRTHESLRMMLDLSGEGSNEFINARDKVLMQYKARKKEIAELLALLMAGSEE